MNLSALVRVLLELFGPFLLKLLDDLLNRAADKLGGTGAPHAPTAIRELFAAARAETWPWQVARRRALRVCESVALAHSIPIAAACIGGPVPTLTVSEQVELAEAL